MSPKSDDQDLKDRLEETLKAWHYNENQVDLSKFLPNLFQKTRLNVGQDNTDQQQPVKQLILDLLTELFEHQPDASTLLRRLYINDEKGFVVANSLGISEPTLYRKRRKALEKLTELAQTNEQKLAIDYTNQLEKRLEPPSYTKLFGLDNLLNNLRNLLQPQSEVKLLCLAGIGGIGKTTLADALTRQLIRQNAFDNLIWLSARQKEFTLAGEIENTDYPAFTPDQFMMALDEAIHGPGRPPRPPENILYGLKTHLAKQTHLIVLDNLETTADYQALLPLLQTLSQCASILLTSRIGIYNQPDVYTTNLSELKPPDAEALVRYEAFRRGVTDLAEAPPEAMTEIYEIAGGNPLALKLIVGQVQIRSLKIVLADLHEAKGRRAETLYEFIYQHGWDLLTDKARRVLLVMPMVAPPGTTLQHLVKTTRLTYDDLNDALDLLIKLSLVNVGGHLNQRRYYIHRLTETFLHKQVTKWLD